METREIPDSVWSVETLKNTTPKDGTISRDLSSHLISILPERVEAPALEHHD